VSLALFFFERQERITIVSILASLRKGFGYLLMSMGISSPVKKRPTAPKPAPRQNSGK